MKKWIEKHLNLQDIRDRELGVILSQENMQDTRSRNPDLSLFQLEKLLNQRTRQRIQFLCTEKGRDFAKKSRKRTGIIFVLLKISGQKYRYTERFWKNWNRQGDETHKFEGGYKETIAHVEKGQMDLYDTAALCLIRKRIFLKKETDEFSQIILDEAQDFGETVYYVLRQVLPRCYFTIMGDVSQNIRYETGLNDWEDLKKILLRDDRDSFYLLAKRAKSYRNTIEISQYAGRVLEKASLGNYKIQPVIRHGNPVCVQMQQRKDIGKQLKALLENIQQKGFETIAVICRDEKDTETVRKVLQTEQEEGFHNGIMVLPVTLTKGLEFDAVVLWQPDTLRYGMNVKEAKLLYVAITRALHELYLLGENEQTELLKSRS